MNNEEDRKIGKITSLHAFPLRKFKAYREYYGLTNNEALIHLLEAAGV